MKQKLHLVGYLLIRYLLEMSTLPQPVEKYGPCCHQKSCAAPSVGLGFVDKRQLSASAGNQTLNPWSSSPKPSNRNDRHISELYLKVVLVLFCYTIIIIIIIITIIIIMSSEGLGVVSVP